MSSGSGGSTTSFYGSSCANNGKGALNTPERGYQLGTRRFAGAAVGPCHRPLCAHSFGIRGSRRYGRVGICVPTGCANLRRRLYMCTRHPYVRSGEGVRVGTYTPPTT
eukprot:6831629-Pyramimonas_sp.AAC.1